MLLYIFKNNKIVFRKNDFLEESLHPEEIKLEIREGRDETTKQILKQQLETSVYENPYDVPETPDLIKGNKSKDTLASRHICDKFSNDSIILEL